MITNGLLVKATLSADAAANPALLSIGGKPLGSGVTLTPLMPHLAAAQGTAPGMAGGAAAQWYRLNLEVSGAAAWNQCHQMLEQGLGVAGSSVQFAEPDLIQQWQFDDGRAPGLGVDGRDPKAARPQDIAFPVGVPDGWYRKAAHGNFEEALSRLDAMDPAQRRPVRIAHLDTGYDPDLLDSLFTTVRADLAYDFVENRPGAADETSGPLTNRGHGTGTLGILAGQSAVAGRAPVGAAPFVEVVPLRVANRVVLFSNSTVARALDHVLQLCRNDATRIDIVTMSMGGLASQAWADAINALYDAGVFVVTAAGNNVANLPTRSIVYPARFNRVVAACGVMANGKAYADLAINLMAGNYGPKSKMATAMAAYTPNTPWVRLGGAGIVDHDGAGTSSATPQIAAAAAIWLAANKHRLNYGQPWMVVEAVRKALFASARAVDDPPRLGHGTVDAAACLKQRPAQAATLKPQPRDDARLPLLTLLTGGLGATGQNHQADAMLELEALQLSQHWSIEGPAEALADGSDGPPAGLDEMLSMLATDNRASAALRARLGADIGASRSAPVTQGSIKEGTSLSKRGLIRHARNPDILPPARRRLRIYAADPSLVVGLDTFSRATTTVDVRWEPLAPGPIGEYVELVDVDPASQAVYAPVDLEHPSLLHDHGLAPNEADPRFHQQMVYAVVSRTIEHFERALGRKSLWAPHRDPKTTAMRGQFVQRLRIYPHGLRTANAYYSPAKKALMLGYFRAQPGSDEAATSRPVVFAALSHDIIAHETAHALLDGLHRRFIEPTNPDCLAFHEAFADIVAMFLHFTMREAVRPEIAATRGDLFSRNRLGELAFQFGQSVGERGALRDYIGAFDDDGQWKRRAPRADDYEKATEPHARGAVLVAAVFDAFLNIYEKRARKLFILASGGKGIVEPGELIPALIDALTEQACKLAGRFLDIMIRALDYCPPFDITFGEYLRAVITADLDLVPNDPEGFRVALASAFRVRGIYPAGVKSVSPDALAWSKPELATSTPPRPDDEDDLSVPIARMELDWPNSTTRLESFLLSNGNAQIFHRWLVTEASERQLAVFGILPRAGPLSLDVQPSASPTDQRQVPAKVPGKVRGPEVHSVRTLRRVGPDGTSRADLIIELTQSWVPDSPAEGDRFRGGCTVIIDRATNKVQYVIRKRVTSSERFAQERAFRKRDPSGLYGAYFHDADKVGEPFAMLHSALGEA